MYAWLLGYWPVVSHTTDQVRGLHDPWECWVPLRPQGVRLNVEEHSMNIITGCANAADQQAYAPRKEDAYSPRAHYAQKVTDDTKPGLAIANVSAVLQVVTAVQIPHKTILCMSMTSSTLPRSMAHWASL